MFSADPDMTLGMNRSEVSSAVRCCTSWKNKLKNHSITLSTAQESITITQMDMKAEFLQRELGIRAGLPSLSCRPTQKTKAGTRASEMAREAILGASRILETLAVMDLWVQMSVNTNVVLQISTYASTYDSKARQLLARTAPTQSISLPTLDQVIGSRLRSRGRPQKLTAKNAALAAAHI